MWKYILPVALVAGVGAFAATRECPSCHAAVAASPANAKDISLEGVDLGKFVAGPAVKAADLKGKAVVVEYWGDRCPPCLRSIPHLCATQKTYGRDKLIVVANQVWTNDAAAAKKAFESRAPADYKVSVINHGAVKGAHVDGVPHAFVFNPDGTLRWQGHPAEGRFNEAVKAAAALVK